MVPFVSAKYGAVTHTKEDRVRRKMSRMKPAIDEGGGGHGSRVIFIDEVTNDIDGEDEERQGEACDEHRFHPHAVDAINCCGHHMKSKSLFRSKASCPRMLGSATNPIVIDGGSSRDTDQRRSRTEDGCNNRMECILDPSVVSGISALTLPSELGQLRALEQHHTSGGHVGDDDDNTATSNPATIEAELERISSMDSSVPSHRCGRDGSTKGQYWTTAWIFTCKICTCCIPEGWIPRSDPTSRQAWREKVATVLLWFTASALFFSFLLFIPRIMCNASSPPPNPIFTLDDISKHSRKDDHTSLVSIFGAVYNVTSLFQTRLHSHLDVETYQGLDLSHLFARKRLADLPPACLGSSASSSIMALSPSIPLATRDEIELDDGHRCAPFSTLQPSSSTSGVQVCHDTILGTEEVRGIMEPHKVGDLVFLPETMLRDGLVDGSQYIAVGGRLYNVSGYVTSAITAEESDEQAQQTALSTALHELIMANVNQDATYAYRRSFSTPTQRACLDEMFYIGDIYGADRDQHREHKDCAAGADLAFVQFATLMILVPFIGLHVVCSLIHASRPVTDPAVYFHHQRRRKKHKAPGVLVLVPCYNESHEELKRTMDSLLMSNYGSCGSDSSSRNMIAVVIVDGIVPTQGGETTTPEVLSNLLGFEYDHTKSSAPLTGSSHGMEHINEYDTDCINEHMYQYPYSCTSDVFTYNTVSLHAGLYKSDAFDDCGSRNNNSNNRAGRALPYVVMIKRGCIAEQTTARAGNRGKRDSQLLLLHILNRLSRERHGWTPLDHQFQQVLVDYFGLFVNELRYMLAVDADTRLATDAVSHLVYQMEHNPKALACCGETEVDNKYESWVTMIQVFEYYTSHHLKKAFESSFGCVTCLPGCFSMYRLYRDDDENNDDSNGYDYDTDPSGRSSTEIGSVSQRIRARRQLLINDTICREYGVQNLQSLHEKNLLELGEDRMLTTLLLNCFPDMQLIFVPESTCWTAVPHSFTVLLSQRRRWINSTLHNMLELLLHTKQMCGTWCCSMKFIVLCDLAMTILMPAAYLYFMTVALPVIVTGPFGEDSTGGGGGDAVVVLVIPAMLMIPFIFRAQWEYLFWFGMYVVLGLGVFYFILPIYAICNMDDLSWGKTRELIEGATGADTDKDYKKGKRGDGQVGAGSIVDSEARNNNRSSLQPSTTATSRSLSDRWECNDISVGSI